MSLPDHLPVDSNILSLVSSESYCVSYPVTLYCYSSVTKAHILPHAIRPDCLSDPLLFFFHPWQTNWDCDWRISTNSRTPVWLGTRIRRWSDFTVLHSFSPTNLPVPIVNPRHDYWPNLFYWLLRSTLIRLPGIYRFAWTQLVVFKMQVLLSGISFQKAKAQNLFLSDLLIRDI